MKKFIFIALFATAFIYGYSQPKDFKEVYLTKNTEVKDQEQAGTCWSFATTSFIESEVLKESGQTYDLSEAYFAYFGYVNKAIIYVRLHGLHNFGQGGQAHDVIDVVREYGIVPESVYPYSLTNHDNLEKSLKSYLDTLVKQDTIPYDWMNGYVDILNSYMSAPPSSFEIGGNKYTPKQFAEEVLKFNPDNYVEITSYSHKPFYNQFVLEVPDNWALASYYNVNIDDLMQIINNALKNGYSVDWDGDVSERGFLGRRGLAFVTEQEMLEADKLSIQKYRQLLFNSQLTTDDHLMHLVGLYKDADNKDQYLIKNSWGAYGPYSGYLFMSADFVKLKTVAILVNKSALPADIKAKLKID